MRPHPWQTLALLPATSTLFALLGFAMTLPMPRPLVALRGSRSAALDPSLPPRSNVPMRLRTVSSHLPAGTSLSQNLKDLGLLRLEREALMDSMRGYLDPAHVAAGVELKTEYFTSEGTPSGDDQAVPYRITMQLTDTQALVSTRTGLGKWTTSTREAVIERQLAAFSGVVNSTLWNSATSAGMDPQLIDKLTELFAWQMDFNRDIQEKDRWRLTIEHLYADGKPYGYGDIIAAQYDSGGSVYTALRFAQDGAVAYYQPDGASLQSLFLKMPLRFGHITSGFSAKRYHPILKINKPHLGIDYGAPVGTPVLAVGDGQINFAAMHGSSGKMITIRHSALYQTQYKHLNGFAPGVGTGTKVHTGQVIGYVGMTGLATGPHLHFEFHVGDKVVDPEQLHFPSASPVAEPKLPVFRQVAAKELAELPPWSSGALTQTRSGRPSRPTE